MIKHPFLAKFYEYNSEKIELANSSIFFIQVIDVKKLSDKTSKKKQILYYSRRN